MAKNRDGATMAERAMNLARELTLFGHMKGTQMTGLATLLVAFADSEIARSRPEDQPDRAPALSETDSPLAAPSETPKKANAFWCPAYSGFVGVDEDGCCRSCGHDTEPRFRNRPPSETTPGQVALELLRRIRGWDHLDGAADGPFWKREIDKALAGTAPAPPPHAWQPIETAPKDRTTILGYTPHAAIMVGDVYYDPEQEHWARLPASDARVYPTHWTPLPDPPVVVPSVVKKD